MIAGRAWPVSVSSVNGGGTHVACRIAIDPGRSSRTPSTMRGDADACAHYALLLAFLALSPAADAASTAKLPAVLERARYVALGYDLGDGFVSADRVDLVSASTIEGERRAIEAIRRDLEKWSRYIVTDRPEQADILIMVRRRPARVDGGRQRREQRIGQFRRQPWRERRKPGRLQPDDRRAAFVERRQGRRLRGGQRTSGDPPWSGAAVGGLAGAPPRLYKSFREEVEAATKKP